MKNIQLTNAVDMLSNELAQKKQDSPPQIKEE